MKIAILTIFPEMFQSLLSASILGRARADGLLMVEPIDIRPFSTQKHKNTDDYPFGGGAGMVMTPQPIVDAVEAARANGFSGPCLYMSPRGTPLTQAKVRELAGQDGLILLCGHYEGVDQRALDLVVDEEISLGDFVLTGGELAAMAVVDAVARLVPGVLGSSESAEDESFSEGLLEYPQYTRPREYRAMGVPEVLLNGDHAKINAWRRKQALLETFKRRPDLFDTAPMTTKERAQTLEAVHAEAEAAVKTKAADADVKEAVKEAEKQMYAAKTQTMAASEAVRAEVSPTETSANEPQTGDKTQADLPKTTKAKQKRQPADAAANAPKAKARRTLEETAPASEVQSVDAETSMALANAVKPEPKTLKVKAKRAKEETLPASVTAMAADAVAKPSKKANTLGSKDPKAKVRRAKQ